LFDRAQKQEYFREREIWSIAYEVLLGISYLHKLRITHGSLNLESILVDKTKRAKILYVGKCDYSLMNRMKFKSDHPQS